MHNGQGGRGRLLHLRVFSLSGPEEAATPGPVEAWAGGKCQASGSLDPGLPAARWRLLNPSATKRQGTKLTQDHWAPRFILPELRVDGMSGPSRY